MRWPGTEVACLLATCTASRPLHLAPSGATISRGTGRAALPLAREGAARVSGRIRWADTNNDTMHQNHLVLIGSQTPSTGATTFGTGFLARLKNHIYVVTCRHVIREASLGAGLFAIPKPRKTKNPPGGYAVLQLARPRFHANDGACTYDVAVAKVTNANRSNLRALSITPVELTEKTTMSTFEQGARLRAVGYPIDYANAALAANSNEPLPPYELEGMYRPISLTGIAQHGFNAPLCEAFFAEAGCSAGKGMSGGLVYSPQANQVAGLVLASGEFEVSTSPASAQWRGFIFASSRRVFETLTSGS